MLMVPPEYRIRIIELRSTTGLVFFINSTYIYGVRGHTPDAPVASPPPRFPPNGRELQSKWAYVPASKADSIQAMGTR